MRLLTFEAFDLSDEKTLPDQQKDNEKDKYNDNDKDWTGFLYLGEM